MDREVLRSQHTTSDDLSLGFFNRHLDGALADLALRRPGSAPPVPLVPQMDELAPGSPLAAANDFHKVFQLGAGSSLSHLASQQTNHSSMSDMSEEDRFRATPQYLAYYYQNKNINPRLPPPIISREQQIRSMWGEKPGSYSPDMFTGTDQLKADSAEAQTQAALSLLFGNQLNLKDGGGSVTGSDNSAAAAAALLSQGLGTSFPQRTLSSFTPGTQNWATAMAAAATSSEQDPLQFAFGSPKPLNPLITAELTKQASTASSLYHAQSADEASLQEMLFGSGANTPRSTHAQMFEAASKSMPMDVPIGSSQSGNLGITKDPKLPNFSNPPNPAPRFAMNERGSHRTPSKLRMSSNTGDQLPMSDLNSATSGAQSELQAAMQAFQNFAGGGHPGFAAAAAAAGLTNPSMPPTSDALSAVGLNPAGLGPDGMPMPPGMPSPQHMQAMAMYMQAMYPFYAQQAQQGGMPNFQQAMQAATMFPGYMMGFPGYPFPFPGMPGFPGMPAMPGMMPDMAGMRPPFPMAGMPGFMPGMPPLPMNPTEYAAFYQKMMEAQAAAMGGTVPSKTEAEVSAAAGVSKDGKSANSTAAAPSANGSDSPVGHEREAAASSSSSKRGIHTNIPPPERSSIHVPPPPPALPSVDRFPAIDKPREPRHIREAREAEVAARRYDSNGRGGREREPAEGTNSGNRSRRNSRLGEGHEKRPDAVLEEFKNNKNRRYDLKDILGHIFEFSLDQHGSRFIQQKLENALKEDLDAVFEEVLPKALVLTTDVFGNYVIQKCFEYGNPDQKLKLVETLKGHILQLSLQMYGCRVVQKALESIPVEQQCELVAELDGHIMRCVRDQNGNHVIQKCIECVPTERISGLIDNFLTCVVPLSTHPFGCRVIQRILEYCQDAFKKKVVMDEIMRSTIQLAQDQYGNYVIQHILEHGTPAERLEIIHKLASQIVQLSMHKFASNVVEKCLAHCNQPERDMLIALIMAGGDEEGVEDPLQQMMKDQFGNYVVQKVLEVCDDDKREILLGRVRAQLHALKKYTYGKHIVARVEKLLSTGTKFHTNAKNKLLPDDSQLPHPQPIAAPYTSGRTSSNSGHAADEDSEVEQTQPSQSALDMGPMPSIDVHGLPAVVAGATGVMGDADQSDA